MGESKLKKGLLITGATAILIIIWGFILYPKVHHTYQMMFTELGYWNDYKEIYGLDVPEPDKINNIFDELGPFGEGLTYTVISYKEKSIKDIEQSIEWKPISKKAQKDIKEFERVANSFPNVKKDNVFKIHPVPFDDDVKYSTWKSREGHITVLINSKKQNLYILETAAD